MVESCTSSTKFVGQENYRSLNSMDSQMQQEIACEANGSLPEINSNDSTKRLVYETMSKQNLKGSIAIIGQES